MSTITVQQRPFGTLENGETITCYSLRNASGLTIHLLNYGATLNAVQIPDSRGKMHEVTLGSDKIEDYTNTSFISGVTQIHTLSFSKTNSPRSQRVWQAHSNTQAEEASITFTLKNSIHTHHAKLPIEYELTVKYILTSTNELIVQSEAKTDALLPIFMTQHPIWNLVSKEEGNMTDHILQIWSKHYHFIEKAFDHQNRSWLSVADNPLFNFQQPQRLSEKQTQISSISNYNVRFLLDQKKDEANKTLTLSLAARIKAPISGRTLEIYTTQAGLKFSLDTQDDKIKGFCLTPCPLYPDLSGSFQSPHNHFAQETRYKFIG